MADAVICPLWLLSYGLTPAGLRVYLAICAHQGRRRECWPSQTRLMDLCGCSLAQVRRAVVELCKAGLIRVDPLHGRRGLTYHVLVPVGKTPPTPFICSLTTPSLATGEVIQESLEKTDSPPTAPRRRRGAERVQYEPTPEVVEYIADMVLIKTKEGSLKQSPHAYATALAKLARDGQLDLRLAAAVRAKAQKLRGQ